MYKIVHSLSTEKGANWREAGRGGAGWGLGRFRDKEKTRSAVESVDSGDYVFWAKGADNFWIARLMRSRVTVPFGVPVVITPNAPPGGIGSG